MPAGWIHQMHDMIVFGQTYPEIHRLKDACALKVPGRRHREVGHEWYQKFGKDWDFSNPFPESVNQQVRDLGRDPRARMRQRDFRWTGHMTASTGHGTTSQRNVGNFGKVSLCGWSIDPTCSSLGLELTLWTGRYNAATTGVRCGRIARR